MYFERSLLVHAVQVGFHVVLVVGLYDRDSG